MSPEECQEVFSLLSQYLDRELPLDLCRQLESHISGCAPCVEFVASLRKTVDLCRSYASEEKPGPLPEGERERLRQMYEQMLAARGR
jgi:anti-sigma factor RsiW